MSWLLENWFGSKENLEQVKEEIRDHVHKETYLGISGIENPEQSANRISSKELTLGLVGPWGQNLNDAEHELLQMVHDELPSIVRDEVGVIPFYTSVLAEGYLVLTFIRNAGSRGILLNKLPLALVTPDGKVVAKKTFDMISFGPIGDQSSRPCEFLFRWNEFDEIPEEEVPLSLVYVSSGKKRSRKGEQLQQAGSLSPEELSSYSKIVMEQYPVSKGQVDLRVLEILSGDEGGLKVVVLFRNGLDKRLEFTEVPILIRDKKGEEVASLHFGLKNLRVDPQSTRIWAFYIPEDSLKKQDINPAECTAFIPEAKPEQREEEVQPKGLIQ